MPALVVEPVEPAEWARVDELLGQYGHLPLGIVDVSVVATCERLGVTTLATLDPVTSRSSVRGTAMR